LRVVQLIVKAFVFVAGDQRVRVKHRLLFVGRFLLGHSSTWLRLLLVLLLLHLKLLHLSLDFSLATGIGNPISVTILHCFVHLLLFLKNLGSFERFAFVLLLSFLTIKYTASNSRVPAFFRITRCLC